MVKFFDIDFRDPDLEKIRSSLPPILDAVRRGLDILELNYKEELEDNSISWMDNPFSVEHKERVSRFLSRMTVFVVTVCSVDSILKKGCEQFVNNLGLSEIVNKQEYLLRESEIMKWSKMRNKVFAHSSFAQPKYRNGVDSRSLQLTSLHFLGGNLLGGSENNYYIGGSYSKYEDEDVDQSIDASLEKCGIVNDYNSIVDHYIEWDKMFKTVLESYLKSSA